MHIYIYIHNYIDIQMYTSLSIYIYVHVQHIDQEVNKRINIVCLHKYMGVSEDRDPNREP